MREPMTFDYKGKAVRTIERDGEPWWVLKDVCEVLGIKNAADVSKRLDEDERDRFNLGRQGEAIIINESGLYNVILRSDKAEAKPFRKWVTGEVLPSIRRTGGYGRQDAALLKLTEQVSKLTGMVVGLYEDKARERKKLPEAKQITIEGAEARELCGVMELLERNGLEYGAAEFNMLLRQKGYLEKREVPRLWGEGEWRIDFLTEKGKGFGQNNKRPRSSRGAQPKYYADKFMELYREVTEE